MLHGLIGLIDYPRMFLVGLFSGGASLYSAVTQETPDMSIAFAVVAIGAVLAQPALKAYKAARAARREEDTADMAIWSDKYSSEVRQRAELQVEVARLTKQNGEQAQQMHAMKDELDDLRRRAGTAIKQVRENANAQDARITAIEQVVPPASGSGSNLNLPVTKGI